MSRYPTQGWLPLDFEFDPRPGVVTGAGVRWLEFGTLPLDEPFFWQTVEKLRALAPPAVEIDTTAEAMFRLTGRLPAVVPAGFIFHISHCGSTLIANAMRNAPNTLVAAEAMPFVRLARWHPEPSDRYLRARWFAFRRRLFEATFRLFAHYRTGGTERLVVKFSSINTLSMNFVRQAFPEVPCVLVVRDPNDVLVSTLNENGWLLHKNQPGETEAFYGWTGPPRPFAEMSNEEYCAGLLGRHLEAAREAVDARCKVIDYEDLNPKRMHEIAAFFGLELPRESSELGKIFGVYSKDPSKALVYRDDRGMKRRALSREASVAAQRWAMPHYIELRASGAF
jgi:hypothetical protein